MEILGAFFGIFLGLSNPQWFDNGPYEFIAEYETLGECQLNTHGTEDICTTESPFQQYSKVETKPNMVLRDNSETIELDYVECDAWQGCYNDKTPPLRNRGLKYGMQSSVFFDRNFGDKRHNPVVAKSTKIN